MNEKIRPVQKVSYAVPFTGDPQLHEEIMWYATDDGRVLGAVIRDRYDNDFGWIVLTQSSGGIYRCIDVITSYPTVAHATSELHMAMLEHST
jgi:hypothetical protein